MGRLLGIDYGGKRIGLAVSDMMGMLATPYGVIERGGAPEKQAEYVNTQIPDIEKAKGDRFEGLVIGLPLMLDGSKGEQAQKVELFADTLRELTGLKVVLWDERLTTSQVERSLKEMSMTRKQRKSVVDASAAAVILQSYLDSQV